MRAAHRGRAVRGTVVAAAAMAALTASQAPGAPASAAAASGGPAAAPGTGVSGDSVYRTELPPLRTPAGTEKGRRTPSEGRAATGGGGALPATVFAAYRRAERELAESAPGCGLRWQLLAAIGQVESGHARGGRVGADGTTLTPILGPRLDGNGFALIRDTDGGAYDGDAVYDRAVGPMQFIPSTWAVWGADGNGDGAADPGNVHDAALAAGRYLCAGGRDLSDPYGLDRAILGYNHSTAYLRTVRAWFAYFLEGHRVVPDTAPGTPGEAAARPERPAPRASGKAAGPGDGGRRGAPSSPVPSREPAPSSTPSRPASPSPSPSSASPTRPGGGAGLPSEPVLPVPGAEVVLPGGPVGNGKDSMVPAPSTTPDTGR
ncbi:lytic transglycosylase domain-containing protein [Streptomyces sp. NPDC006368]|uniref:lytic transglycosylase domain-containing protein n=1 Tax=Streptomyces sp. NPDC006368 TaxID=3156760 RepID=UPI0033B788FE